MSSSRYGPKSKTSDTARGQCPKRPTIQRRSWQQVVQRAQADPGSLTGADVKVLQRSIGNRATTQLLSPVLQAKLSLGAADDRYEHEADRVAEQVVQRIGEGAVSSPAPNSPAPDMAVQRQQEEEELQMKAMPPRISPLQRSFVSGEDVQRQEEEEEMQMKPLHGPAPKGHPGEVEQGVQQQIQGLQGKGRPMDQGVRREMEQGFGRRFDNVRIHTGGQADTLNRSLNARAFTVGNDIVFRKGEFQPGSTGGKRLLAHELTHTVQQGGAANSVQPKRLMIQRAPEKRSLMETVFESDFRNAFYRFAIQEFSTENFECYEAIQRYKQKPRRSVAIQIYNTWVKAGAEKEINTDQSKRDAVYSKVKDYEEQKQKQSFFNKLARKLQSGQAGDPTLFDDIQKVLLVNMTDTFFRWRSTPVGKLYEKEFNDEGARAERLFSDMSPELWAGK